MHQSAQPKNTPGRRRQARNNNTNNNNNTPRKMYASENDLPNYKPNGHYNSPCTPPRSRASGGDASASLQINSANSKQRNNNSNKTHRNRTKNGGATPPDRQKQDRLSPPRPSRQESTPAIFAGSTFHASPAPSALPMPSFFARSHSDSPGVKSTQGLNAPSQEPSPPCTDSEDASSPPRLSRNEESPLEFFFRADRAEKARTHRANSVSAATAIAPGPFSPPHDSPREQNTVPRVSTTAHQNKRQVISQRSSTSPGISFNELDGNPCQPLGPAFSTPYQERIRAARSSSNSAQATPTVSKSRDLDASEALKRFLFHGQLSPGSQDGSPGLQQTPRQRQSPGRSTHPKLSQSPRLFVSQPPSPPEQQMSQHQPLPRGMFPASVLKGYSSSVRPKSPAEIIPNSSQRSDNIITMEDSLRRMLKLSPSS